MKFEVDPRVLKERSIIPEANAFWQFVQNFFNLQSESQEEKKIRLKLIFSFLADLSQRLSKQSAIFGELYSLLVKEVVEKFKMKEMLEKNMAMLERRDCRIKEQFKQIVSLDQRVKSQMHELNSLKDQDQLLARQCLYRSQSQ